MKPALLLLLASSLLAGCGQTGGLYLPGEPAAATVPSSATTAPAPATPPADAAAEEEARKKK